jgi:hypothetical protein
VTSPIGLLACIAIGIGSLVAYRSLRSRWNTAGDTQPARARDVAVLVATAVSALLVVVVGGTLLEERGARASVQRELAERSAESLVLQTRMRAQLDAARLMLAERTVEKITRQKLAEARAELLRFAAFKDPGITQMIALIDQEIAIRATEKASLSQGAGE